MPEPSDGLELLPVEKLRSMIRTLVQEKAKLGKELDLTEPHTLVHAEQKKKIRSLVNENYNMRWTINRINSVLQSPASNRKFMQIARPARECINLTKPFINDPRDMEKTGSR